MSAADQAHGDQAHDRTPADRAPAPPRRPATAESRIPDRYRTPLKGAAWLVFAAGLVGAVLGIAGLHVEITVVGLIMACTAGLVLLKIRADADAADAEAAPAAGVAAGAGLTAGPPGGPGPPPGGGGGGRAAGGPRGGGGR
ncbi:hypothetical protein, partial [Nocardia farcinica]|uniref:hypothetical protein n=1 Tax=Nocardia farcinica TaxID=37329 RepID=UPI002458CBF9